jgi:hypothetical protein
MPVHRLRFHGSGNVTKYIDLNQALSLVARRMKRQMKNVTVYGGYYVDSGGSRIDLNVAPDNWVTTTAIKRGFRIWKRMISETLKKTDATGTGKYNDFKIYLDGAMSESSNVLLPVDANASALYNGTAPEWDYSTLTSEDPDGPQPVNDQFELHIVGHHVGSNPNWTRLGLVESWFNSRPQPSFNAPHDIPDVGDALSNLFDAGDSDDDRLTIISAEGDQPPYDEDSHFGMIHSGTGQQNLQRVSTAFTTSSNAQMNIHGFKAICGLVQLNTSGLADSNDEWELVLDDEETGESL